MLRKTIGSGHCRTNSDRLPTIRPVRTERLYKTPEL
jgi:hypothetical protein